MRAGFGAVPPAVVAEIDAADGAGPRRSIWRAVGWLIGVRFRLGRRMEVAILERGRDAARRVRSAGPALARVADCVWRGQRGQDVVEYAGVLVLVAAIIAAVASIGLPSALARDVKCEIQRIELNACASGPDTVAASRTAGALGAASARTPAVVGTNPSTAEARALGSNTLIDACAGGTTPSVTAEQAAPDSNACQQQLAKLGPHSLTILAVLAAMIQAQGPGNAGNFLLLLESYLRHPGWAVIALSPRAQAEQASGYTLQQKLLHSPGDLWDGFFGSLCGGYGICLGGDADTQAYQRAWHESAQLGRITTPILLAAGIGGVLKDVAGAGLKAALARIGGSESSDVEQAVNELEAGGGVGPSSTGSGGQPTPAAGSGRGGIAPVLKGQAGVQRAIGELQAQGYSIEGQEVTIQTPVGRTRVDIVARDPDGNLIFEVKNGPRAKVNPNQQRVFEYIREHGGTPVGDNAENAGLAAGKPIKPTPVRVIQYR